MAHGLPLIAPNPQIYDCALDYESNEFTRRASTVSAEPPLIRAHFFYSSALPIDDPLSTVPPPATKSTVGPSRLPPRPFSTFDNRALEEAWRLVQNSELKRYEKANKLVQHQDERLEGLSHPDPGDIAVAPQEISPTTIEKDTNSDGGDHVPFDQAIPVDAEEIGNDELESGLPKNHRTSFHPPDTPNTPQDGDEASPSRRFSLHVKRYSTDSPYGSSPSERDTTGTPFLRVGSRLRSKSRGAKPHAKAPVTARTDRAEASDGDTTYNKPGTMLKSRGSVFDPVEPQSDDETKDAPEYQAHTVEPKRPSSSKARHTKQLTITVGVSRLHLVEMPNLKMGPIYWDPVHDVSSVTRGTWFYKDSALPVPPIVANKLEAGYMYLRPWTETYKDELNSCQEIGAEAELKVAYRLWPDEPQDEHSRPPTGTSRKPLVGGKTNNFKTELFSQEKASDSLVNPENQAVGSSEDEQAQLEKKYARCSVIYANAKDAQILRSNQLPSVARGRRPLGPIRKGRIVGEPVIRGFDHKLWQKHHPSPKRVSAADAASVGEESRRASVVAPARDSGNRGRKPCIICSPPGLRPRPTDLVLVIHGIGQKLSERVESFHFTHAINAFRRQVNVELEADAVKPWLREGFGGIMVLPVNWRSTLKLDDGGPQPNPNQKDEDSSRNQFTLKDITADSIPAVRNLISDVMLDIPYYLSHHKSKMIQAVVKEANRIYRLWCKNNPEFQDTGRVHLIAHSLGSVMALDILSNQPTHLHALDLSVKKPRDDIFEFDTKSLFFCGSPAGFFLLLHKAPLLPRRERNKPDADIDDANPGVAGEAGTYGCLAVNNLYNVLHYNDPIAYRLNACVDVDYAYSLQPARVPSAATTWAQYFGSAFRSKPIAPTVPILPTSLDLPSRPGMNRFPTTVELETHNFTQEELAEKRMFLLNDNGQIDFTLRSGGGPLEIQYLNMLSAHSSYWILQDFVRFLVVEIGRRQGRQGTLAGVKAWKKAWGKR
ncbi:MAG: hypothetical protein Q9167_006271 [Letrouitia subvulpina]